MASPICHGISRLNYKDDQDQKYEERCSSYQSHHNSTLRFLDANTAYRLVVSSMIGLNYL